MILVSNLPFILWDSACAADATFTAALPDQRCILFIWYGAYSYCPKGMKRPEQSGLKAPLERPVTGQISTCVDTITRSMCISVSILACTWRSTLRPMLL